MILDCGSDVTRKWRVPWLLVARGPSRLRGDERFLMDTCRSCRLDSVRRVDVDTRVLLRMNTSHDATDGLRFVMTPSDPEGVYHHLSYVLTTAPLSSGTMEILHLVCLDEAVLNTGLGAAPEAQPADVRLFRTQRLGDCWS